jgi:alpha-amylase
VVKVCFYFQVHQPERIAQFSAFDVGSNHSYFDAKKNRDIVQRVAQKCYLPTNAVLLELLNKQEEFRFSFSFSGTVLEQFEQHAPRVLDSFERLVDTGRVEILDETYNHSLSFLYSKKEFVEQVRMHNRKVRSLFGTAPSVFRNTELIYNNDIGKAAEEMGYKAVLAEGADHILSWRSPNFVYRPQGGAIKLLLKNYRLSDDIAFRFSNQGWSEWPLTAEKFSSWVHAAPGTNVNLFMDYETFGEHQWASTGIFNFLRVLPRELLKNSSTSFVTPSQLADMDPVGDIDVPNLMSWADVERDLSAWTGNPMQDAALAQVYALEQDVKATGNPVLLARWRKLQASDHFYYMCTKWFSDGDVHKYFNPHDSPYEAFISYMNILTDLQLKIQPQKTTVAIAQHR